MENKDTVVKVDDLYVNFYNNNRCNKVLRGVSFELKKGKILCIVGESGCGKSVTANSLMGLLPELSRIESGEIHFYYQEKIFGLTSSNARERRCGACGAPEWP